MNTIDTPMHTHSYPSFWASTVACDNIYTPPQVEATPINPYSFGCKTATPVAKTPWGKAKKQEGITPMANYNAATIVAQADTTARDQRQHLHSRMWEVQQTKKYALKKQFHLIDDDAPKSPKEMAERIAAGKFIIRGLDKEETRYFSSYDAIVWRDPAVKPDQAGYDAVKTEMDKKYRETVDTITILDPKDGLDALREFEAWTPTGAAN